MEELFGNEMPGEDRGEDGIEELFSDAEKLSELREQYIAEVEARAAEILDGARAEAQKNTETLRQEVFNEIAEQKAEAETYCQEKRAQADAILREAEDTADAAQARLRAAESAYQDRMKEAEAAARVSAEAARVEAARIVEAAEAEAEEIRGKAESMLQAAQEERNRAVYDHERIEADGREYLEVMEKHALARLDMVSELLRNQQDWAFRAKQNVDELNGVIAQIREKYEEDYRY